MDFKLFLFVFIGMALSSSSAGPAPKISRVGIYYYRGQPAVIPIANGRTLLFYYYYGYGHTWTEFNGSRVRCSTFRRIINYRRIIIGWGERCVLPGRNGLFKFKGGSGPYHHGHTYMEVSVKNGRGRVHFG